MHAPLFSASIAAVAGTERDFSFNHALRARESFSDLLWLVDAVRHQTSVVLQSNDEAGALVDELRKQQVIVGFAVHHVDEPLLRVRCVGLFDMREPPLVIDLGVRAQGE